MIVKGSKVWDSFAEIGYIQKTTFFEDFSIAEAFGESAIRDTYRRAFNEWKGNYKYLTELVLVLNRKIWYHHRQGNIRFSKVYNELWEKTDAYALDNLKDDELDYFLTTTD